MLNKNTKGNERGGVWRKRFRRPAAAAAVEFSSSLADDERLVAYDLACGLAHVRMLARRKIISQGDCRRLVRGLDRIKRDHRAGKFRLDPQLEDVHMNVERRLKALCGPVAEKFHTARSRNDLVASDLRLYCRDALRESMSGLLDLQAALLNKALEYPKAVVPGYTHLQPAQPVLFAFYLMSHFFKFQRDLEGMKDCRRRVNVSPLGAGALSGTTHPVDPGQLARSLGFKKAFSNAMDAVADRDFLGETLYFLCQAMIHVSSLAEDLIILSTPEFGRVLIDESYATGSSIMPQKRNPDICELLRAKSAKAIGNLTALLCLLKGLPQAYNRDLQETKGIFFKQADETLASLRICAGLVRTLKLCDPAGAWAKRETFSGCTDLVDRLVRSGCRFREAYDLVAECVGKADGSIDAFIEICGQRLGWKSSEVASVLKPENSVRAKISPGGTGIGSTRGQLSRAGRLIKQSRRLIERMGKEDKVLDRK